MAINRGALMAQTYQLPAPQQQAPIQESPFVDEVGDPAAGLQQIDGVTDQYFQKWAALKGFAKDVQENLGIDVRFPDPSVPESTRLHRIYLKSLADLKAQGERLKTGQQMFMADRQRGALMTQDPNSMYYDQMDVGNDIIDKELDPIVTEANEKLKGPYYYGDKAIGEAKAYYNQVKSMLEKRKQTDAGNAGYWQKQIDALVMPTESEKQWDPNRGSTDDYTKLQKGRIKAAQAFLKKMTNLQKGTADSYQLSETLFGPKGERIMVSDDTKGDTWGGKEVVRNEYHPESKKTFKVLKDKDGNITKTEITDIDPMTHSKGYISDNTRYAANGEYLDVAADELGLLDENTGEVRYEALLAEDAPERFKKMESMIADPKAKMTVDAAQKIRDLLGATKPGTFWDDVVKIKIKGGKQLKIEANPGKTGTSYEIKNWKEIWPNADEKLKRTIKGMSKEDLENLLFSLDAHLQLLPKEEGSGTKAAPTSTPSVTDW